MTRVSRIMCVCVCMCWTVREREGEICGKYTRVGGEPHTKTWKIYVYFTADAAVVFFFLSSRDLWPSPVSRSIFLDIFIFFFPFIILVFRDRIHDAIRHGRTRNARANVDASDKSDRDQGRWWLLFVYLFIYLPLRYHCDPVYTRSIWFRDRVSTALLRKNARHEHRCTGMQRNAS